MKAFSRSLGRMALVAIAATPLVGPTSELWAQDIILRSVIDGAPVPTAYFDDIADNPNLFTLPTTWPRVMQRDATGKPAVSGTLSVLVVPALHSDTPNPRVSSEEIQRILFDGPTDPGTLSEFYTDISGGRLTITGAVSPWVRTNLTLFQVTAGSSGFGPQARVVEYVLDALTQADATMDFRKFDNDGPDGIPSSGDDDGVVDVFSLEFMEVAGSCGGPGIWPHRSAISWRNEGKPFVSRDVGPSGPIEVDGYIIQSVSDCAGDGTQTSNVISHEMGHALGLPDLYQAYDGILPTQRRWVVGCWGLMAAGSWGCGSAAVRVEGFGPTRMTPWALDQLGWVDFQDVGPKVSYETFLVPPTMLGGKPLRIPLSEGSSESLVLEYRIQQGFDSFLPSTGVLAYYWDEQAQLKPTRDSGNRYGFHLLEADGQQNLLKVHAEGGNRGQGSDAMGFPGSALTLSAVTTPSTTPASGEASTVTVHSVRLTAEGALITVSTAATPTVRPTAVGLATGRLPTANSSFLHSHPIGGGTQPFSVEMIQGPEWLTATVIRDNLFIGGVPEEEGSTALDLQITDAKGTIGTWTMDLDVGAFNISAERLKRAVLEEPHADLSELERHLLDEQGNGNGHLDIGDIRKHLTSRR